MATRQNTADFILEQTRRAGVMRVRRMFGEFALYCDDKTVAFICDDQLFMKPTAAGRAFAPGCPEAPPHPAAKNYLLVDPDAWDDSDWLTDFVRVTAAALEAPKPKAAPRKRRATERKRA
jgi:DNA transformation protein